MTSKPCYRFMFNKKGEFYSYVTLVPGEKDPGPTQRVLSLLRDIEEGDEAILYKVRDNERVMEITRDVEMIKTLVKALRRIS